MSGEGEQRAYTCPCCTVMSATGARLLVAVVGSRKNSEPHLASGNQHDLLRGDFADRLNSPNGSKIERLAMMDNRTTDCHRPGPRRGRPGGGLLELRPRLGPRAHSEFAGAPPTSEGGTGGPSGGATGRPCRADGISRSAASPQSSTL